MVRGIINFFSREINGLHEAAYLLGGFAILSQVLALLRDRLLAHVFGAGTTLDLYYAAFRVPDFLFAVVASLLSASIIIPFLSERVKISRDVGREFLSAVFTVFLLTIVICATVAFFLIPTLIPYLFPGFSTEPHKTEVIALTRILLLSPIFLGLSNLLASVTQLYNRFFIYGISPLLYNLGIIFGVIFLVPRFGPSGLAWGVVIGAIMHFLIQVPFVARQGLFPKIIVSFKKFQAITGVILVAFPRTLALSAQEVSRFFLVSLASLMSVGSISVFTLSHNLQSVPLSIIGVSYSLAAFPSLAGFFVAGDRVRFIELLQTTARYIIFFSLPLIALFVVLRAHIVRVILGSGEFSWQDTRLTAAALALFVISLAAQGLILLFTRAWYATGNTKTPFYINIFSVIVIIFSAAFLSRFVVVYPEFESFIGSLFRVEDIQGTSVLMLPLAYSFGTIFGACAHLFILNRKFPGIGRNIVGITSQLSIVAVLVGFVSYLTLNIVDNFISLETFWGVFSQGLIAGVVGSVSGIILLTLFGSRELSQVFTKIRNKFWKATPPPVIGPDPSSI